MVWVSLTEAESDWALPLQRRWLARQCFAGEGLPLLVGIVEPHQITVFHRDMPETHPCPLPFPNTPKSIQAWRLFLEKFVQGTLYPNRFHPEGQASTAQDSAEAWQETHRTRKEKGRYYTPFALAARLSEIVVRGWLAPRMQKIRQALSSGRVEQAGQELLYLRAVRICDPSVGSGIFLQGAFQTLCRAHAELVSLAHCLAEQAPSWNAPPDWAANTLECAILWEQHLLNHCLYGVDVDEEALRLTQDNIRPLGLAPAKINPPHLGVGNALLNPMGGFTPEEKQAFGHANRQALQGLVLNLSGKIPLKPLIERYLQGPDQRSGVALQGDLQPFCWELQFAPLFWDPEGNYRPDAGFDILLGNPPWEKIKANRREVDVHETPLKQADAYQQTAETTRWFRQLVRRQGHFLYQSPPGKSRRQGSDDNLYKLFVERTHQLLSSQGGMGLLLVKNGLLGDLGTCGLRHMLLEEAQLRGLWQFHNKPQDPVYASEGKLFPDIDPHERLCAVWFQKGGAQEAFWPVEAVPALTPWLHQGHEGKKTETMSLEDVQRFSPTYWEIPVFRGARDREVMDRLGQWPRLADAPWQAVWGRELDMSLDRHHLLTEPPREGEYAYPLWEGRLVQPFQMATTPHRWVTGAETLKRFPNRDTERLVIRLILPNSARKINATLVPPGVILGNSLGYLKPSGQSRSTQLYLLAFLNSLVVEYWLRHTVSGMTLNFFKLDQVPIPPPLPSESLSEKVSALIGGPWGAENQRFRPLISGIPKEECQAVRLALEVAVAHRFGLTESDWSYVLDSFSLPPEEKHSLLEAFTDGWPQNASQDTVSQSTSHKGIQRVS